ncbi:hypothetical protein [Panacagrimonas sp.]|uniref:hypothetical protein n=1 Tax=Panacagrimonas sp. TaxID=2480088 RepID=UPI003B527533
MKKINWKGLVGTVAPTLAAALGGPLAGMAVRQISQVVLGAEDGSEEQIEAALATAGPDMLTKLREADRAFQVRMRELDIDEDKLHQIDRASAREREAKTGDSLTPQLLAAAVTVGFFGVLATLLLHGKPLAGGDALLVMLGSLGTAWTSIIAYYYGSSAGSKAKSAAMEGKR